MIHRIHGLARVKCGFLLVCDPKAQAATMPGFHQSAYQLRIMTAQQHNLGRRPRSIRIGGLIALLLALQGVGIVAAEVNALRSPDGRIQVSIQMPEPGTQGRPRWAASFVGKAILSDCSLGLETADAGALMAGAQVVSERRRSVDERIPVLFGKSAHANDRFNEFRFSLETPKRRHVEVVFRCYDDAVAVRYALPTDGTGSPVTIVNETTSFRLSGEPTALVQYLENFKTSHEHNVTPIRYGDIRPGVLLDLPLTFSWSDNTCVAITEASLRRYAGMALMRPSGEAPSDTLVCQLTPRADGTKVVRSLPMQTPWRVVLMGDRPGAHRDS